MVSTSETFDNGIFEITYRGPASILIYVLAFTCHLTSLRVDNSVWMSQN